MTGHITALYASLIGLLLVFVSMQVVKKRRGESIGIGDNGDPEMQRRIRVQANLVEYAPIALLLLFFCETRGIDELFIHAFGILLVGARVLHAVGLGKTGGYSLPRFLGALVTFLLIVFLCGINIVHYFID